MGDNGLLAVLLRPQTWLMYGFFKEAMQGLQRVSFSQGYGTLLINPATEAPLDADRLAGSLRGLAKGLLVVAPELNPAFFDRLALTGFPTVLLYARHPSLSAFVMDNEAGAAAATEHLISLGHKRVAFLAGLPHAMDAQERLAGYAKVMRAHGLPVRDGWIKAGEFKQAMGFKVTKDLLRLSPRPTAIFAANDYMALGAISAVQDEGLSVPEDVAVVGFDDLEMPNLTFRAPPLTTVRQPIYDIAKEGTECLVLALEGRLSETRQRIFPSQLVVRESCGAALKKSKR